MNDSVANPFQYSKVRAYAQLLRLPNVFTALADVLMGALVVFADDRPAVVALLAAASACLYLSGMVLNDVFDFDIDVRERPQRPLPSGRIKIAWALRIGCLLLAAGVAFGVTATGLTQSARPALVSLAIAAAVVAYDRWLKRTPFGPLGMGLCRLLNVLLGMSAADGPWQAFHYLLAGAIGVYIVGVTWFARTEAETSNRLPLGLATLVMALGIAGLVAYPHVVQQPSPEMSQLLRDPARWYLLCGLLGGSVLWRCLRAIGDPQPENVQAAVKNCIMSLIVLDAAATYAMRDAPIAAGVVLLLIPAAVLGRWIYST